MRSRWQMRWHVMVAALAMACGGTVKAKPAAAPAEGSQWDAAAWMRAKPCYTAVERAYVWERFDPAVQIARDFAAVNFSSEMAAHASLPGLAPGEYFFTIHDTGSCAELDEHPVARWFGSLTVDVGGQASFVVLTDSLQIVDRAAVAGKIVVAGGPSSLACGVVKRSRGQMATAKDQRAPADPPASKEEMR